MSTEYTKQTLLASGIVAATAHVDGAVLFTIPASKAFLCLSLVATCRAVGATGSEAIEIYDLTGTAVLGTQGIEDTAGEFDAANDFVQLDLTTANSQIDADTVIQVRAKTTDASIAYDWQLFGTRNYQ